MDAKERRQKLFNHMAYEYDKILLESELEEIERIVFGDDYDDLCPLITCKNKPKYYVAKGLYSNGTMFWYEDNAVDLKSFMNYISYAYPTVELTSVIQAFAPADKRKPTSCKYVKRLGESCTLNNNCQYPNCPE